MGECTRLIYDLIDKLEEDDILLIDFEKAFDTVEWSFIEKTLQFYGFGPSLQKWIKAFYCDISSAVTNNGHVSEFFSLRNLKKHYESFASDPMSRSKRSEKTLRVTCK